MKRFDTISIVAGGWSVGKIKTHRIPGLIIGVNDATLFLNKSADIAITMDRLWAENRWYWLTFHHFPRPFYVRRSARKNLPAELPNQVFVFENDHTSTTFAEGGGVLNGTNSGFCALNLAYQLRPKRLLLFGFDMNRSPEGKPYWFPEYKWAKPGGATTGGKYQAWAGQFEAAAEAFKQAGIEVLNASPTSAIGAFPKIDPEQVLCDA
jgi:hypothetical protein